jgi:hypothetical protein
MRRGLVTRGIAPMRALRRAVTLPTVTPRKGEHWIT